MLKDISSFKGGQPGYTGYRNPTVAAASCEELHWKSERVSTRQHVGGKLSPAQASDATWGPDLPPPPPSSMLSLLSHLGGPGSISFLGRSQRTHLFLCLCRQELKTSGKASNSITHNSFPSLPEITQSARGRLLTLREVLTWVP